MTSVNASSYDQASLLYEISLLIEREDEKGLKEVLENNGDIETVFLPFPPASYNQKTLMPAIYNAIKKSMSLWIAIRVE
jgi:hypothetical protein